MRIHKLKTWPEFFSAVADGRKPFEVRRELEMFEKPAPGTWMQVGTSALTDEKVVQAMVDGRRRAMVGLISRIERIGLAISIASLVSAVVSVLSMYLR